MQLRVLWDVYVRLIPRSALDGGTEALEIEALSSCGPGGNYDL